jgi:SAM-dependent methyltransferase
MWVPRFACPECRGRVADEGESALACSSCRRRFERRQGIYRFLVERDSEKSERFERQYRTVRERDGYRGRSAEYYRMLPIVVRDDPRASEWRIRRESYTTLQRQALPGIWKGPSRVLDVGAGNGWLAHRLAAGGHEVAAVDRLDDDADGLGACRHYPVSFSVVQADFDALPFGTGEFDVVVLNGSLHYSANPQATLAEARRALADGGSLVVMDSPMFARRRDGEAMVDAQTRSFATDYGISDVVRIGVGFLTFRDLEQASATLGLSGRFYPSRGPVSWRVRRQVGRLRLRRAPAAFGVWVGR